MNPYTRVTINREVAKFRAATKVADAVWNRMHPRIKQVGQDRLKKLQSMSGNLPRLIDALKPFTYRPDKINLMEHPEFVCLTRRGDCDASARLLQTIFGDGTVWAIIRKIESSDDAGHLIYVDVSGGIWSNFGYEGQHDMLEAANYYVPKWRFAVEIKPGVIVGEIIER